MADASSARTCGAGSGATGAGGGGGGTSTGVCSCAASSRPSGAGTARRVAPAREPRVPAVRVPPRRRATPAAELPVRAVVQRVRPVPQELRGRRLIGWRAVVILWRRIVVLRGRLVILWRLLNRRTVPLRRRRGCLVLLLRHAVRTQRIRFPDRVHRALVITLSPRQLGSLRQWRRRLERRLREVVSARRHEFLVGILGSTKWAALGIATTQPVGYGFAPRTARWWRIWCVVVGISHARSLRHHRK